MATAAGKSYVALCQRGIFAIRPLRHPIRTARLAAAATVLAAALSGCDTLHALQKCGRSGCPGDAQTTARIEAALRAHPEISLWDIQIQTLDRVVYLHGLVDTNVQRDTIETVARADPQVVRVVDSISLRNFRF